jgi:hypothetical protein
MATTVERRKIPAWAGSEVIAVALDSGRKPDLALSVSLPPTVPEGARGMVTVPAHPGAPGSGELFLEARKLPGNRRVLPVFSTVGKLVDALGQALPWAMLPLERARQMATVAGIDVVALDPVMSPETWKWRPQDLDEFEQRRRSHE